MFRRFRTPCLFHRHRSCSRGLRNTPKRRNIKFRRVRSPKKKEYDIHNTAKVWNQVIDTSFSAMLGPDLGRSQTPVQILPESISSTVHDANRWPSSNASVKNVRSRTSIPQFASWSQRLQCSSIWTAHHWMLCEEINVYLLWESYITHTHIIMYSPAKRRVP